MSETPNKFHLQSGDRLYFLDPAPTSSVLPGYCIAFLADRTTATAAAADASELSLAETWEMSGGLYLFLNVGRDQLPQETFVPALQRLLRDPAFKNTRFMWLQNPLDAASTWRLSYLRLAQSEAGVYTVEKVAFFNFRNFTLRAARGSRVDLNNGQDGFNLTAAADNPTGFLLTGENGATQLTGVGSTVALPFQGDQAGSLQFDLTLYRPATDEEEALFDAPSLDMTLRFFFPETVDYPGESPDFFVASRRYPLFSETADDWQTYYALKKTETETEAEATAAATLTLYATLDPLNHLTPARTYFSFIDPDTGAKATELPSCYRTNMGYTVHLTPHDEETRLIFGSRLTATAGGPNDPYYLVPSGDFEMTVPRYEQNGAAASEDSTGYDDNLLCGLSGVEYIKLTQDRTNLLSFSPGYNAYSADFVPGASLTADSGFTGEATTAWLYPRQTEIDGGTATPVYYAQPDQAVLYNEIEALAAAANNDDLRDDLLEYMEVPATTLPAPNGETPQAFPMPPYGGVFGPVSTDYYESGVVEQLEQQLVSPQRRALLHQISATVDEPIPAVDVITNGGDQDRAGVTPQGLLTTFSTDYKTVQSLTLALDTAGQNLELTNIGWNENTQATALRAALQTHQLFMVISDPTALEPYFSGNQLTIQGWTFDLDPASWTKQGTILIFKFYDKPMTDLVENAAMWASPTIFNADQEATRSQLLAIIADVEAKTATDATAKDQENYKKLGQAFANENWSGIIALNVNVPPTSLPDELQGIAGAIDQDQFYAHHVGVETTPITVQGGDLVAGQSSLFGLIDYTDETIPSSTESGYNYQVTSLNVRFQNSEISAFSCDLTVTLDQLFDEYTSLQNSTTGRNIITLKGTAEEHDGEVTYAFNFSGDNYFDLPDSEAIDAVEIVKAQFTTDSSTDTAVSAHFSFWGRLHFAALAGFDILSFGPEDPAEEPNEKYLTFSNLVVTVAFQIVDGVTGTPEFAFDPRNMAFDLKQSTPRDQSLYAKFPLKFTGFTYAEGEKTPDTLGYMTVKSPLSGGAISDQKWYALTFNLTLGNLGALMSDAGLTVSIIAAWSPSGETGGGGVAVGLRLPGSGGGKKALSLQGVMKLSFESIEFVVGETGEGETSYLLKLKNIMIKFFVINMPPSGQTEIIIFGDPTPTESSDNKTLGWYAAYAK